MEEYKLELKQIVDYPRCRMYRQFIRGLIGNKNLRISGNSGLYYYTVLSCFASFRTEYNRVKNVTYTVYPGEWIFEHTFTEYSVYDYSSLYFDEARYIEVAQALKTLYETDCYAGIGGDYGSIIQIKEENELTVSKNIESYSEFKLLQNRDEVKPFRILNGYAVMETADNKDLALQFITNISHTYSSRYINDMVIALLELVYRVLQIIAYVQNSSSSSSQN